MDESATADPWGMDGTFADNAGNGTDASARNGSMGERDETGRPADVHAGDERAAANGRHRVDAAAQDKGRETQARQAAARREEHVQLLQAEDVFNRTFNGAQFIAFVRGDIKLAKDGSMHIVLQVPYEYRHHAMPMLDAVAFPLSVDVRVWKPYVNATGEDNGQVE